MSIPRSGSTLRRASLAAPALASVLLLSGCDAFSGPNSWILPGTIGTSGAGYRVHVELPDVSQLTQNAQVKVGNVAVGSVQRLSTREWHAVADIRLRQDVALPANAVARIGQNSLLGANYLELAPPSPDITARGRLGDGDTIPLGNSDSYPTTEQILAATSVVLNGGGVNHLQTITEELHRALGGQRGAAGQLLPRLQTFVSGLDQQRVDIVHAIDGLNAFSGQLARQKEVLGTAIDEIPPALKVLNEQRHDLTQALYAAGDLGATATSVIKNSQDNLVDSLQDLSPVLHALADSGDSLARSLDLVGTFPFPAKNVPHVCFGDYCNVFLTLDLTMRTLDANLLSGTPAQNSLNTVEHLLGTHAGIAGAGADPLLTPILPTGPTNAPTLPPNVGPEVQPPPTDEQAGGGSSGRQGSPSSTAGSGIDDLGGGLLNRLPGGHR